MKKEPVDIKSIRARLGFTQEDLARKLGLALSTISKWEQSVTSPSCLAREKLEKMVKKGGKKKKWVSLHPKSHEIAAHGWKDGMMPTQ